MSVNKMYGKCQMCGTWHARDGGLMSINVRAYDKNNDMSHIKLRVCKNHFDSLMDRFRNIEWSNDLRTSDEVLASGEKLAD